MGSNQIKLGEGEKKMIHFNFFSPKSQPGNTTKEAFAGPVEGCYCGFWIRKGYMVLCMGANKHDFRSQHLLSFSGSEKTPPKQNKKQQQQQKKHATALH